MSKIKPFGVATLLIGGLFLGSCTLSHTAVVTNNPVGTKTGTSKSASIDANQGVSYSDAMKDGRISKVSIGEYKLKNVVIFLTEELKVAGE